MLDGNGSPQPEDTVLYARRAGGGARLAPAWTGKDKNGVYIMYCDGCKTSPPSELCSYKSSLPPFSRRIEAYQVLPTVLREEGVEGATVLKRDATIE